MIASACAIASFGTGDSAGQKKRSDKPRARMASPNTFAFHDSGEEQKPCR